jgi:hypothetical protein
MELVILALQRTATARMLVMSERRVTSIRLNADLLERASAYGFNLSRLCEAALQNELNKRLMDEGMIPSKGAVGISRNSRIVMNGQKFKNIERLNVGDKVVSFNLSSNRFEEANVIDVGPLTLNEAFATVITIENSGGTKIDVLPDTQIYCWMPHKSSSSADWISASDIQEGYYISTRSHKSASFGSTTISKVKKTHVRDVFYRLEVYPNNNFYANSNVRRMTHFVNDYMPSVWAFPIKGYPGQIGALFEHRIPNPKAAE